MLLVASLEMTGSALVTGPKIWVNPRGITFNYLFEYMTYADGELIFTGNRRSFATGYLRSRGQIYGYSKNNCYDKLVFRPTLAYGSEAKE